MMGTRLGFSTAYYYMRDSLTADPAAPAKQDGAAKPLSESVARLLTATTALAEAARSLSSGREMGHGLDPSLGFFEDHAEGEARDSPTTTVESMAWPATAQGSNGADPVSPAAMRAFVDAWTLAMGSASDATAEEIDAFVRREWETLDAATRQWVPRIDQIWAPIQSAWPNLSDQERADVMKKWRPVFEAFDKRLQVTTLPQRQRH
jgi:hypothetical protein